MMPPSYIFNLMAAGRTLGNILKVSMPRLVVMCLSLAFSAAAGSPLRWYFGFLCCGHVDLDCASSKTWVLGLRGKN